MEAVRNTQFEDASPNFDPGAAWNRVTKDVPRAGLRGWAQFENAVFSLRSDWAQSHGILLTVLKAKWQSLENEEQQEVWEALASIECESVSATMPADFEAAGIAILPDDFGRSRR